MMGALGPYAGFIATAYALAALAVVGLIVWVVAEHRALRRALAELEAKGLRRRSARPGTES